MPGWSHGYVAGASYSIAWQAAATPANMALACAMAGRRWQPRPAMVVADLGCGRGYNANLLAAANPGWTVLGLDHEPAAIAEAMQTAGRAGLANALFAEADLGTMREAEIERLPPLDVVLVHGVWTWVSDAVRAGILRLIERRLKPGGVAYFGYNALPAAGVDAGLQRLLRHLAGPFEAGGGSAAAARAMTAFRGMADALPLRRTAMRRRLEADPPQLEPGFVAHEFLTQHWRPVFHADLCRDLAAARLEFVGSANLFEALPGLFCDAQQMAVMAGLVVGQGAEFIKDICLPRSFRADVFIRGARACDPVAALDAIHLAAIGPLPQASPVLNTGASEVALPQGFWEIITGLLDAGAASIGDMRAAIGEGAPHPAEMLALLVGTECALPVFQGGGPQPAASRFNLAAAAIHAGDGEARGHFGLASPHAVGGIPASALDLALVAALIEGADPGVPEAIALQLQPGLDEDRLAAAARRIAATLADRVPVWRRFGVI